MASSIQDYTTYDQIRALLGVSAKELKETVLSQPLYLTGLLEDLYSVNPQTEDLFDTLPEQENRTPAQRRFARLVERFSALSVARQLIPSMPMFAPRAIGDGKATMTRFNDAYKETIDRIEAAYELDRDRLGAAIDDMINVVRPARERVWLVSAGLDIDPVTGQ